MAALEAIRARKGLATSAEGAYLADGIGRGGGDTDVPLLRAAYVDQRHHHQHSFEDDDGLLSYANLLQELLAALLGYTGDVFVDSSSSAPAPTQQHSSHDGAAATAPPPPPLHPSVVTVRLAPDIGWVEPRDRGPLDGLAALGFHFKQLRAFVAAERGAAPRSAYRQALCAGITEFLGAYEDTVLGLQRGALDDPRTGGLAALQYRLLPMRQVLPALHELAWELRRRPADSGGDGEGGGGGDDDGCGGGGGGPRGADLLRALHRRALNGQPALQAVFQRLLWHCHQALFQQLHAWMVHGLLIDDGGEFFVQRSCALPPAQPDGAPWSGEDVAYHEWHSAFSVNEAALPPGISAALAASIEFTGKAVRLLRAPASAAAVAAAGAAAAGAAADASQQQAPLLPPGDQLAWAAALGALARAPRFSEGALERTVGVIRADVAARLWRMLVVRARLVDHLAAVKDYLLLARGDFWSAFLEEAAPLLSEPPRPATAAADAAAAFAAAAPRSSAASDPMFRLFALRFSDKPGAADAAAGAAAAGGGTGGGGAASHLEPPPFDPAWDGMWLDARLPWPLGLLVTPRHLGRYNALFQLLLRLRRAALALEATWSSLGRRAPAAGGGGANAAARGPTARRLLELRQHMAHLIGNLQVYLQVDVIESNFAALTARAAAAQDFREAERAHDVFLHALVTQAFLPHATLCRQLGAAFGQARRLAGLAAALANGGASVDELDAAARALAGEFAATAGTLYVSLQSRSLQQYDRAPHLRQLHLRLDFNGHIGRRRLALLQTARAATAAAGGGTPTPAPGGASAAGAGGVPRTAPYSKGG